MRKKHVSKIIIILLMILILFNFIIPPKVYADGESSTTGLDTVTGIFMEPTMTFFTFVVDSVITIFSNIMTNEDINSVMQSTPINDQTDVGATFTIEDEDAAAYKNFIGLLSINYPNFTYSPEEIFSNEIDLLDVNFISGNNGDEGWQKVRSVISSWYKVLRMVAIIGLLSVLIYTGIKIIISSNTQEKAKYKERIVNWFIAVLILFTMHYIMVFILLVVEEISAALFENISGKISVTMNGTTFTTNLMGLARFQMQQQHFSAKIGHFIIYVALVTYTFKFTFLYLKRVLNMAFLTLIAPIVALTYPIQKMDGKAAGFQMWIKEFLYNVLLQPMHYILYYILVSSSLTLAVRNPLYGIVAIAFISNAEKLLKRIFGFGKANAGTVGGIAGAYATGTIVSSITGFIREPFHIGSKLPSTSNAKNRKNGSDSSYDDEGPIKTLDDANFEKIPIEYLSDLIGSGQNEDNEENIGNGRNEGSNNSAENINETEDNDGQDDNNSTNIDIDESMGHYRSLLKKLNIELPQLIFDDGDPRSLEDLFEQINLNYENLKKAGLSDEEIEKINEQIIGDKSIFKSRVWLNELPYKLTDIPLQYLDNDNRTSEQISDDIFKHMEMSKQSKYTKSQRRNFLKMAKEDMSILSRRMSENMYIENMQRNGNNMAQENVNNRQETVNNEKTEKTDNKQKIINSGNQEKSDNKENGANNPPIKGRENAKTEVTEEKEESNNNARRIALGLNNVGRTILKPVWDKEKSDDFNKKRLVKNIVKGATGFAVGVTTATVQAGISITDGKYKALEGAGSLAAGAIGGTKLVDAVERLTNKSQDEQTIEEYSKTWFDRDDVIKAYNNEYNNKAKEMRERARTEYVMRGIVDLNEQKQAIKFADELIREGKAQDEADRIAVATLQYKQTLIRENNYTMLYDNKRRNRYLEAKTEQYTGNESKDSIRNRHIAFIENVRKFDRVNNT